MRITKKLTKEELEEGRRRMEEQFVGLLEHDENEGLTWKGTKTDLMEIVHAMYCNGNIRDDEGYPVTMAWLVDRACRVLHVVPPVNPYYLAQKGRIRKGVICPTFAERYTWIRKETGRDAITNNVRVIKPKNNNKKDGTNQS